MSRALTDETFDPIEELNIDRAFTIALDEADYKSIGPCSSSLNAAVSLMAEAEVSYRSAREAFKLKMEALGYEVRSTGTYEDERYYLVHSSAPSDWDDWSVRWELEAKQLVIAW